MKKDDDILKYFKPNLKDARRRTKKVTEMTSFEIDSKYLGLGNHKKYLIQTYGC